jgi:hypothetical protein
MEPLDMSTSEGWPVPMDRLIRAQADRSRVRAEGGDGGGEESGEKKEAVSHDEVRAMASLVSLGWDHTR